MGKTSKHFFAPKTLNFQQQIVLVLINTNAHNVTQQFSLNGMNANNKIIHTFTPYYTHPTEMNMGPTVVVAPNGVFTYTLPAQSVSTLLSN